MFEGPANSFGLFGPGKGYVLPAEAAGVAAEPTATVMWEVLAELEFLPLLWSACPWHTHVPGQPLSNRTPTAAEAGLGTPFWRSLVELFGIETVVAVGNVAHSSLVRSGLDAPKVRHPAHGGRSGFKRGLEELLLAGMGG
jgi:uracil-DNA glycosylase